MESKTSLLFYVGDDASDASLVNLSENVEVHPQGGIALDNGTMLPGYPREDGDDTPQPARAELKRLLVANAFFLLSHRDRIMSDSRMFLTPVDTCGSISFVPGELLGGATVGGFLEWWEQCEGARVRDAQGHEGLVCALHGSSLSGDNRSLVVYDDGHTGTVQLTPFKTRWVPFVRMVQRYAPARRRYQAMTLPQLLEALRSE